ncbi:Hypothetical protein ERS075656_04131 [Mycobacteroides abscessus]|nr:Hypothetical protein ERS075656_04131 [Mycobacteroides abscessus]
MLYRHISTPTIPTPAGAAAHPAGRRRRRDRVHRTGVGGIGVRTGPAASAGPAATDSALEEILRLQRQGDQVIVHRRGDKPLQMCVVTAIRQRSAQYVWTRPRIIDPRPGKRPTGVGVQLIIRTLDVDVQC